MLNTLAASEAVSLRGGAHGIEHPEDPGERAHEGRCASIWATAEMQGLESRTSAARHLCDQSMYGGESVKPTCISGTLDGLETPGPRHDWAKPVTPAIGRGANGEFNTTALARYPEQLCIFLASCITCTLERFARDGTGPTGW